MDHLLSIRAFVVVVRFGTFTRAAWHLKMSMPALSRAVGNLEAHTQTRLLHRSTRHVLLADSARDYYTCCCKLLDCLHESELRLAKDRETPRGVIRVAVHPMAMESGLPQQVEVLRAEAPEIGLTMTVESGRLTLELGHYDVAVYPRLLISDTEAICRKLAHPVRARSRRRRSDMRSAASRSMAHATNYGGPRTWTSSATNGIGRIPLPFGRVTQCQCHLRLAAPLD